MSDPAGRSASRSFSWSGHSWLSYLFGEMRTAFQVFCLVGVFANCSAGQAPVHSDPQLARSNIVAALPTGWSVTAPPVHQEQGFTKPYFTHPRTESFTLLGPQPNYVDWTDRAGQSHREYLAKECLYVWISPSDFKPKLPSFSNHALKPDRVFVSRDVRVYGYVSHYIADTNRMDQIMQAATMISSPEVHLSWTTWKNDIARSLSP